MFTGRGAADRRQHHLPYPPTKLSTRSVQRRSRNARLNLYAKFAKETRCKKEPRAFSRREGRPFHSHSRCARRLRQDHRRHRRCLRPGGRETCGPARSGSARRCPHGAGRPAGPEARPEKATRRTWSATNSSSRPLSIRRGTASISRKTDVGTRTRDVEAREAKEKKSDRGLDDARRARQSPRPKMRRPPRKPTPSRKNREKRLP